MGLFCCVGFCSEVLVVFLGLPVKGCWVVWVVIVWVEFGLFVLYCLFGVVGLGFGLGLVVGLFRFDFISLLVGGFRFSCL